MASRTSRQCVPFTMLRQGVLPRHYVLVASSFRKKMLLRELPEAIWIGRKILGILRLRLSRVCFLGVAQEDKGENTIVKRRNPRREDEVAHAFG